jgi:formyltetrahydrofolate deformylase
MGASSEPDVSTGPKTFGIQHEPPPEVGMDFVLTLSCPDRAGIVSAVADALVEARCTIVDSQQFADPEANAFFMRVAFRSEAGPLREDDVRRHLDDHTRPLDMSYTLTDTAHRNRVLLMVSRQGHCLADLLFRVQSGHLAANVVAVVSNHTDFESFTQWYGVPFHHIPVDKDTKPAAEEALRGLIAQYRVDTVVLARYMQILSDELCVELAGRAINIHHSLLPSFRGARPYHQAYDRGVKVIGATAHYVTAVLDEGPIIEQDFVRVDHTRSPHDLASLGRDLEALALARALKWHVEQRVLLYGNKTIVFT